MADDTTLHTRKQQFVRGEIWDAAVDLFAEQGFEGTTIDDIAEAAGVSRRSFFRYFSSKDDLMVQGILTYGTVLTETIKNCPQSYSPIEVVHRTVLEVAKGAAAHPRTRKIIEIADHSPGARAAQLSRFADVEDRVAQAFTARCKGRTKNELTPRLLAGLTLSMLDLAFRLWYKDDRQNIEATVENIFVALTDLIRREPKQSDQRRQTQKRHRRKPAPRRKER